MAALQDFLHLVAVHCTNAPTPAMETAVREAAREFCRRTLCHQATLAPVNSVVDQAEYTLPCGTGLQVAKLLGCRFGGRALELVAPSDFDSEGSLDTTGGAPDVAMLTGTNKVMLYRAPNLVAPIVARVALEPTMLATTVADEVFEQHAQAIAAGAVRNLAITPEGRDERLASAMAMLFEEEIGRVLARTYFNRARSRPRSTPTWC